MQTMLGLAALALAVPTMSISSQLDAAGAVHMRTYDDDNDDILLARREDRIDADINSTITCSDTGASRCTDACQQAIFDCYCQKCRDYEPCKKIEAALDSGSCDATGTDISQCQEAVETECYSTVGDTLARKIFACGVKMKNAAVQDCQDAARRRRRRRRRKSWVLSQTGDVQRENHSEPASLDESLSGKRSC